MNESGVDETNQTELDFPLWRLLNHTRYMIFRSREMELARLNLTPEQAFVLDIVHAAGGSTTINHIVDMTQRKHNSISALVNRMAKQGTVRKRRTRADKRAFRVLSTEKGEELLKKVPRDSIHRAFSCLDGSEKERLAAYLNRLMASAYDAVGVRMPFPSSEDEEDCRKD